MVVAVVVVGVVGDVVVVRGDVEVVAITTLSLSLAFLFINSWVGATIPQTTVTTNRPETTQQQGCGSVG